MQQVGDPVGTRAPARSAARTAPPGCRTRTRAAPSVAWKSARSRSSLFTKIARGRPASTASSHAASVWTSTPSTAETTTITASTARIAERRSPTKSAYPGASSTLILTPFHSIGAIDSETEMPLRCSSGSWSETVLPSSTVPMRVMAPGGEQHGLEEGGLARTPVADQQDVADVLRVVGLQRVLLRAARGRGHPTGVARLARTTWRASNDCRSASSVSPPARPSRAPLLIRWRDGRRRRRRSIVARRNRSRGAFAAGARPCCSWSVGTARTTARAVRPTGCSTSCSTARWDGAVLGAIAWVARTSRRRHGDRRAGGAVPQLPVVLRPRARCIAVVLASRRAT